MNLAFRMFDFRISKRKIKREPEKPNTARSSARANETEGLDTGKSCAETCAEGAKQLALLR